MKRFANHSNLFTWLISKLEMLGATRQDPKSRPALHPIANKISKNGTFEIE